MVNLEPYDLGPRRQEWADMVKAALARAGRTQEEVAADVAGPGGDLTSKKSSVNGFVNGDPGELRRWFVIHPSRVEMLVKRTGITPEGLLRRLAALREGAGPDVAWHPAFPELDLEAVEIPAPLAGAWGTTPGQLATRWLDSLGKPDSWLSRAAEPLVLVGPAGSSREIAALQIQRELLARIEAADLASRIRVEIVPAGTSRGRTAGTWQILCVDRHESWSAVRPTTWGPAQAVELAGRLGAALGGEPARRLRKFTSLVQRSPAMVGEDLAPGLMIWLLARVARSHAPTTTTEARRMLVDGAWSRVSAGRDALAALDGMKLLGPVFAELAVRPRDVDEVGGWRCAPEAVILGLLEKTLSQHFGVPGRERIVDLVDKVQTAVGKEAKTTALERLRKEVERCPARRVLDQLMDGGLFERLTGSPIATVRAADPQLAAIWAAHEMARLPSPASDWSRLLDPDWGLLIEELARRGRPYAEVVDAVRDAPPELAVDAALWCLRHAAAADITVPVAAIEGPWANVLWAAGHGWLSRKAWNAWKEWHVLAGRVLEAISWRYDLVLPALGEDPVGRLYPLVTPAVGDLVAAWRTANYPFDSAGVGPDLRARSPAQNVPDCVALWDWWGGRPERLGLLLRHAEAGNEGCRTLLVGGFALGTPESRTWRQIPARERLRAALKWGMEGSAVFPQFDVLFRELCADPDSRAELVELAVRIGADALEGAVDFHLGEGARHPRGADKDDTDLWLAIAERLALVDVLETWSDPGWLAGVRLETEPLPGIDLGQRGFWSIQFIANEDRFWPNAHSDLGDTVARRESLAERAAVALWRLGRPNRLRDRWSTGSPGPDVELVRQVARLEGALSLVANPPGRWADIAEFRCAEAIPLDELAELGRVGPESPWEDRSSTHHMRRTGHGAIAAVGAVGIEQCAPRVLDLVRGAYAAATGHPDTLPDALGRFLEHLALGPGSSAETRQELQRETSRRSALTHLLALGDPAPFTVWSERADDLDDLTSREIRRCARTDDSVLDRAWRALPVGAADRLRRDLLVAGSCRADRERPLPFVVEVALHTTDIQVLDWLGRLNDRSAEWTVVLRRAFADAPDARTRAHAAIRLLVHMPGDATSLAALREWAYEDPEPFAGGTDWYRVEDRWVGGCLELLESALRLLPDHASWVPRLWGLAITLPTGNPPYSAEEAPETCTLHDTTEAPWPLPVLADALVGCDQADVVVASSIAEGAPPRLRKWLEPWWLARATVEALGRILLSAPTEYAVLDELLRRPADHATLAPIARALAEEHGVEWLLARVDPADLPAVVARAQTGTAAWREVLADAVDAASARGWEHPPTLLGVRRRILAGWNDGT